jgi:predicted dienelactone hydrolase
MTLTDILLTAALAIFVLSWWIRRTPARRWVLIVSTVAALVISVAGFVTFRWQNLAGGIVAFAWLIALGGVVLKNRITKTDRTGGVPWVTGIAVAFSAAMAVIANLLFPVNPLPRPTGQYAVGVRAFEIADASRPGVYLAKPDEARRLLVRVWYPAQDVSGLKPAPYFTAAETTSTARSMGTLVGFPEFFTYVSHVTTNSYTDAPLLAGAKDLPVVFYSHGYTSFLQQNTVLMEELASHGYVVFSVQHTYDSSDTAFLNGDVAPMDPALQQMTEAVEDGRPSQADALAGATLDARLESALAFQEYALKVKDRIATQSTPTWVADRLFLHDTLEDAPPANVADIAAASNFRRVGEMGMSFGGAISGEICMIDPRCAAGINLDGGNFPFTAFNLDVPAPFLMFHSDMAIMYRSMEREVPEGTQPRGFNEFSYERIGEAGLRDDVYRVQLKGAAHMGISDFTLFMDPLVRAPLLGDGPADDIVGAQNAFVLGFFDKHLRGQTNDFPAKQLADYAGRVVPSPNGDLAAWWNAKPEAERAALEARIDALKPTYAVPPLELPPQPATP